MSSGFLQPMMSHGKDGRNTNRSSPLTTVTSAFLPSSRLSSNAAVKPPNDPPKTTIFDIISSLLIFHGSYLFANAVSYELPATSYF